LTARALEQNGISTVVIGSAWDILESCGTPRVLYNDLPLGNPVGKPFDRAMQSTTLRSALQLLTEASQAPTYRVSSLQWAEDSQWKQQFMEIKPEMHATLKKMGEENRLERNTNRAQGLFR
jgi:D-proline reductase (dithiol) PrdB